MRSTLLASSLVLLLSACGGASAEPTTTATTTTATTTGAEQPLVAPGDAQIGDRSTCPVSGEEFVVTESSPTVVHEGRTYYFCCPGCAQRFQDDPSQFQGAPAAGETPPS